MAEGDLLRAGGTVRGVTDPYSDRPTSFDQVVAAPKRRGRRWLLPGLVAAVLVAMGGVATAAYVLGANRQAEAEPSVAASLPSSAPVASPSPAAPVAVLDERSTCYALMPLLVDGTSVVSSLINKPDGTAVDKAKLSATLDGLSRLQSAAPRDMRADIDAQIGLLEEIDRLLTVGGKTSLNTETFKASGVALVRRCAPLVTRSS